MTSNPSHTFTIKTLGKDDIPAVISLLGSLKHFFPEEVVPMVEFSLREHKGLVGMLDNEITSFLVYEITDKQTAEIMWMGVKEQYHGLGLGTMMLEKLEEFLRKKGITQIVTTTLSYTVPYKPYEKVRTFFYHRGFKAMGIQSDYYEDGVDRLILVKKL